MTQDKSWGDLFDESGEAIGPLPDSEYDFIIRKVTAKKSSNSKPMYMARCEVETGQYAKRTVFHNFVVSAENPDAMRIFFQQMGALGMTKEFWKQNPSDERVAQALEGRRFRATTIIRQWQGEDRNNLQRIKPAAQGGTGAPPPPPPGSVLRLRRPPAPLAASAAHRRPRRPPRSRHARKLPVSLPSRSRPHRTRPAPRCLPTLLLMQTPPSPPTLARIRAPTRPPRRVRRSRHRPPHQRPRLPRRPLPRLRTRRRPQSSRPRSLPTRLRSHRLRRRPTGMLPPRSLIRPYRQPPRLPSTTPPQGPLRCPRPRLLTTRLLTGLIASSSHRASLSPEDARWGSSIGAPCMSS